MVRPQSAKDHREVVEDGGHRPGALQVARAQWVQVRQVTRLDLVKLLRADLDDGEAEAVECGDVTPSTPDRVGARLPGDWGCAGEFLTQLGIEELTVDKVA